MENITIKKRFYEEKELSFEVNTQEFYWKFRNHINQIVYYWWFLTEDRVVWIQIDWDVIKTVFSHRLNWWHDSLYPQIIKVLKENQLIKELSKEEFLEKYNFLNKLIDWQIKE